MLDRPVQLGWIPSMNSHLIPRLLGAVLGLLIAPAMAEPYLHSVQTVTLTPQTSYQAERRFSGRVEAAQRVDLGFELAGRIDSVAVVEGASVAAGQPLARLDTQLLVVEGRQLEAQVAEIVARLDQVALELKRQRKLINQGYTAQQRIDDLGAEQQALQAQRQRVAAQRDGVRVRLEKSQLLAPFDGEVLSLQAEQGRVVQAGQVLMRLVETAQNEAVFGVPDALGHVVSPGQIVTVLGAFGEAEAKVLSVSRSVDPSTLTRSLRVLMPDALVVADSSVVYLLMSEQRETPGAWLPMDALLAGPRGTWAVYALNPNGNGEFQLRKHGVETLYQEGGRVYVRTELSAGSRVVAGGVHRLAPGQTVAAP